MTKRTKLQKAAIKVNDSFRERLDAEMLKRFGIETITTWSIFTMTLATSRADGEKFTRKQYAFMAGFSEGYGQALSILRDEAGI